MSNYLSEAKLLSIVVGRMIPEHIRNRFPKFETFVEGYFKFIEQDTGPYGVISNFFKYTDVDRTDDIYLEMYRKQYANNLPSHLSSDFSFLIKNVKSIFRAKGTIPSYEFFFKFVFNGDVTFYFPREKMFKTSSGNWTNPIYLDVLEDVQNDTNLNDTVEYFNNSKIKGLSSGTTAFVGSFTIKEIPVGSANFFSVIDIIDNSRDGDFLGGEKISVIDNPLQPPSSYVDLTIASSQVIKQDKTFNVNDIEASAKLGFDISSNGSSYVISAPFKNGINNNEGFVYLFDNDHVKKSTLRPNITSLNQEFGYSLSYNGTYIAIGAPGDSTNTGALYVFDNNGSQLIKLNSSSGVNNDRLGSSIVIKDTLVVGGSPDNGNGSIMFTKFTTHGSGNSVEEEVLPNDIANVTLFGKSLDINNSRIVVGASGDGATNYPAAYIFNYSQKLSGGSATITQLAKIQSSDVGTHDGFGDVVVMDEDYIIVSAPLYDNSKGAVYVFDSSYNELVKIVPTTQVNNDLFGSSISFDGDNILIGAKGANKSYIFNLQGAEVSVIVNNEITAIDEFGFSSTFRDNDFLISSPSKTVGGSLLVGSYYQFNTNESLNPLIKIDGYFEDKSNLLSESSVLQDSDFYQDFSYQLQTPVASNLFEPFLKSFSAPAGYKIFSQVLNVSGEAILASSSNNVISSNQLFTFTTVDSTNVIVFSSNQEHLFTNYMIAGFESTFQKTNILSQDKSYSYYETNREEPEVKHYTTMENYENLTIGDFDTYSNDIIKTIAISQRYQIDV